VLLFMSVDSRISIHFEISVTTSTTRNISFKCCSLETNSADLPSGLSIFAHCVTHVLQASCQVSQIVSRWFTFSFYKENLDF
jgi:hypothetical protein